MVSTAFTSLYGFLPPELLAIFTDAYVEHGDSELALQEVRLSSGYDTYFAGNRRADGTVRFPEPLYQSYQDLYRRTLSGMGLNADLFADRFTSLVEGDVSPDEFMGRVNEVYQRVVVASPSIRQFYSQNFGLDLSDSAIIASVLDPDIGSQILTNQISIAEVGGEGLARGFNVDATFAASLVGQGFSRDRAQEFFGTAAQNLPILNVLAKRHFDPDDDFDINEFSQALVLNDPTQVQRLNRLLAQEQSSFSVRGGYASTQAGGLAITPR